jgi:acetyltransferase-like isoleucine patch superfamily enzyme
VLLCEALAQLGAVALGEGDDVGLAGVQRARFRRPVLPGDVLDLTVQVTSASRPWRIRGVATSGQAPIAEVELLLDFPSGPRVHRRRRCRRERELGAGVRIGPHATVGRTCASRSGAWVGANAVVTGRTTIGPRVRIFPFAAVGMPPQDLKYRDEPSRLEIGADTSVREHASIHLGTTAGGMLTRIGRGCLLMVSAHLGHDASSATTSSSPPAPRSADTSRSTTSRSSVGSWACISSRASASPRSARRARWCRPTSAVLHGGRRSGPALRPEHGRAAAARLHARRHPDAQARISVALPRRRRA